MFANWRKSGTGPIGCALSADAVDLAQLRRGRGGVALRIVSRPIVCKEPPDTPAWAEAAADALRDALTDEAVTGRNIVTCLPDAHTLYRHLRLPQMPEAELATAVQWRAARELDRKAEQMCTDFFDVGDALESGKQRHEVVAVAAERQVVEAHVKIIEQAGAQVLAVDAAAAATARCLSRETDHGDEEPRFIVGLGAGRSTLAIIRGGVPRFIRPVDFGCDELSGREADFAERLAHEVTLCIHYVNQARLADLLPTVGCVLNAGPSQQRLIQSLNETAQITFHPPANLLVDGLRPLLGDACDEATISQHLLPIGLALYGRERTRLEAA